MLSDSVLSRRRPISKWNKSPKKSLFIFPPPYLGFFWQQYWHPRATMGSHHCKPCACGEYNGWSRARAVILRAMFLLLGEPDRVHYDGFAPGLISNYLRVAARPHQDGSRFNGLQFIVSDSPQAAGRCNPAEYLFKKRCKEGLYVWVLGFSRGLSPIHSHQNTVCNREPA